MFSLKRKNPKILPQEITSYDLLKSFALITMIIDHIGYYFFPDQIEWRIIGRMSMPVWMFLIGYAQARDIKFIALGGVFLLLSNFVLGLSLLPLDILFTIIFIRISIDLIGYFIKRSALYIFLILVILSSIIMPTYHYFEYGTAAFLFAVFGYVVRHKIDLNFSNTIMIATAFITVFVNIILQILIKELNITECIAMSAGIVMVSYVLINFKSKIYPNIKNCIPNALVWLIQLMGRKTLIIYILQMLFFKIGRIVINTH